MQYLLSLWCHITPASPCLQETKCECKVGGGVVRIRTRLALALAPRGAGSMRFDFIRPSSSPSPHRQGPGSGCRSGSCSTWKGQLTWETWCDNRILTLISAELELLSCIITEIVLRGRHVVSLSEHWTVTTREFMKRQEVSRHSNACWRNVRVVWGLSAQKIRFLLCYVLKVFCKARQSGRCDVHNVPEPSSSKFGRSIRSWISSIVLSRSMGQQRPECNSLMLGWLPTTSTAYQRSNT